MRRVIAAMASVLALIASSACVSGDVDEEKPTDYVPAGITPEDATFRYVPREHASLLVLEIHLSTIPLCKREDVPDGHPFVQLEVAAPLDASIGPGIYPLKQENHARIRWLQMVGPECADAAGYIASSGFIQIDEVTEDVVSGSFSGTNPDSKVDLHGSFVAKHCGANPTCL